MPDRALTDKQRGLLAAILYRGSDLSLDQVRKKLDVPTETDFNTREDKLVGCETARRLVAKKMHAGRKVISPEGDVRGSLPYAGTIGAGTIGSRCPAVNGARPAISRRTQPA